MGIQRLGIFLTQATPIAATPMLPEPNPVDVYLAASLIGFSAGTAISFLLLVLTVRAAKLPGTKVANILFAACSVVWNLGGLGHAAVMTFGGSYETRAALLLLAFQFTAAAAWPIAVFALWSPLAVDSKQRISFRVLKAFSVLTCAAITIPLWHSVFAVVNYETLLTLKESTAYNGAVLLTLGIALFRKRLVSRTMKIPSLAMVVGVFGATLASVVERLLPPDLLVCSVLHVLSEQLTLLIVLGAFFLFARFRFSDLFIRYCFRVMAAALTAMAFLLLNRGLAFLPLGSLAAFPGAARVFIEALATVPLLFLFAFVDRHLGRCVELWIFRAPDYRTLLRNLSESLAKLQDEDAIAVMVETTTRQALDVAGASLIGLESLAKTRWIDSIRDGELVELDCRDAKPSRLVLDGAEVLVPVRTEGQVSHVLAIAPGQARRGLVTHEVNFLRNVADQCGHHFDALRREERTIEVQRREAVLQQQVTEAELRALRAQINPHFLFNSLNSIANLVVTDPEKAETMTLRLARVFRHVLANSSRPLISLHEEIEFLDTYLQIEEARFGNRLQVEIAIDPVVAMESIPSLILQPIVENALKHGLGPKSGPGHLWITAGPEGQQVRLRVEDDGVGPGDGASKQRPGNGQSKGVGLENVALRLNALYQGQSRMIFERRDAGGTSVTIFLPRDGGGAA